MRAATLSLRKLLTFGMFVALVAFTGGRATAQVDPNWDHYKVYDAQPKVTFTMPVVLLDQFQQALTVVQYLDRFANPVEKDHAGVIYPINHPELHYSWWKVADQPYSGAVIASNQFGDWPLQIGPLLYLLNPANKNAPAGAPLPVGNHYTVYACTGDPLAVPLVLTDQFYTRTSNMLIPTYFCVPAQKRTADGIVYPILDEAQHYVVYEIEANEAAYPAVIADQFLQDYPILMANDRYLMVPTIKQLPTETNSSTWGRLKLLFR